jgi:predicted dehydrogenase
LLQMKLGIVGLGWWGGTLVDAVQRSEDLSFVAAYTRSRSQRDQEIAASHQLRLFDSYQALLAAPDVDGVVLATPPIAHYSEIVAAAAAGKHVFCEKPFVMRREEAQRAIAAVRAAGVTLGLGYNRRFHPSWIDLKNRIRSGELGVILHIECTMSGPNGLTLPASAWRAIKQEAPCGGLFPMGVHAVDGMIDLVGEVDQVFCQSVHRAVPNDTDDTTSVLFRMKQGMTGYLGTMMATAGTFRFQVYGSKAMALLGGSVHVAGQSSQQRRAGLFGSYVIQPVKGDSVSLEVPQFDVNLAELEAFARAASGGPPYPITDEQMIHGVAVTDAIIASSKSNKAEAVA